MKRIKTFIVAVMLGGFLVSSTSAAVLSLGDPGQTWAVPNDAARGEHIQMFLDTNPGENFSYLMRSDVPQATSDNRDLVEDPTCVSAMDSRCVGKNLSFRAVIPFCTSDADVNCVSDFGTIDSSGIKTSASFSRYFPLKAQNQFVGDSALHLPSGYPGSIFTLPSATHDGGNSYYVAATLQGNGNSNTGFNSPWSFQARVYPIQLQPDQGSGGDPAHLADAGYSLNNRGRNDGTSYWGAAGPGYNGKQFCVANSVHESLCAARFAFPADTRFFLKVRLQQSLGGWMHGRIANPDISITTVNGNTDLEITANPVAVPAVYKMYNYPDMPAELKAMYRVETGGYVNDPYTGNPGGRTAGSTDPLNRNVIISSEAWASLGMEQLKLWLPYLNDQATALLSYWSVRSLSSGEKYGANRCFNDTSKLTGIVTTNATQYSAGPPAFDKSTGVLNYTVASPHYTTQRNVFKGTYDLLMRSDVARCVYGFSNAPVKAEISVTSADGVAQTVSTALSESNGWLHLSANGFEFSSPTITAILHQDLPVVVVPTPEPSTPADPVASTVKPVAKKITITCVKGKSLRKVTSIKPTCPKGYRRK